jgi:hypothetical protein
MAGITLTILGNMMASGFAEMREQFGMQFSGIEKSLDNLEKGMSRFQIG